MVSKITLKTVAEAAGVSIATVDRVLNRREGVRGQTVERVEAAIRQLGYAPSSLAARVQPPASRFAFVLPGGRNPFYDTLEDSLRGCPNGCPSPAPSTTSSMPTSSTGRRSQRHSTRSARTAMPESPWSRSIIPPCVKRSTH